MSTSAFTWQQQDEVLFDDRAMGAALGSCQVCGLVNDDSIIPCRGGVSSRTAVRTKAGFVCLVVLTSSHQNMQVLWGHLVSYPKLILKHEFKLLKDENSFFICHYFVLHCDNYVFLALTCKVSLKRPVGKLQSLCLCRRQRRLPQNHFFSPSIMVSRMYFRCSLLLSPSFYILNNWCAALECQPLWDMFYLINLFCLNLF